MILGVKELGLPETPENSSGIRQSLSASAAVIMSRAPVVLLHRSAMANLRTIRESGVNFLDYHLSEFETGGQKYA